MAVNDSWVKGEYNLSGKLEKTCQGCGKILKQHVSYSKQQGRITVKVWRYKCPFCDSPWNKPTKEEIQSALEGDRKNEQNKTRIPCIQIIQSRGK